MILARVVVVPRPVINDPQGETIRRGLRALGFEEVEDVRAGKYMEVRMAGADPAEAATRVESMCRRLLANGVIEDFSFDVESVPDPDAAEAAPAAEDGSGPGPEPAPAAELEGGGTLL